METKQILRIVLSSPNDVKAERRIMENVIKELNRGVAADRNLRLELILWETDAYPGFHAEGPQGLIDPILKIEDCDIVLGIFWKRFGTPAKGARSGTEHEIRTAVGSWRKSGSPQIMIYFKEAEFLPRKKDELEQYGLVLQFRDEFPKEGLYWTFKDVPEFEKLARNHLTNFIRSQFDRIVAESESSPSQTGPPSVSDLAVEISAYCKKAEALHASLPVAGFATQLKVPLDIEEIYIPLHAMLDLRGVAEEAFFDADHAERALQQRDAGLEISIPEAFRQSEKRGHRGIVILGDPGSGKTTHLKRLLLWCLRGGPETIGLPVEMLPVFLPLRNLSKLDQGLDAFIQDQLAGRHLKTAQGFGERLLQRENLLLLLDGLDEVADPDQRQQVAGWIMDALRCYPSCRFVVTCRFAGYSPKVRLGENFLEMHLRPLTEEQVEVFIHNWYKIVERGLAKDPELAEGIAREKADKLVKRLREPDFRVRRVFELTRNPLLLTNICLVHRYRGGLPQKRARLYEECIDVLLEHWRAAKELPVGVSAQDGMRALQPAALWLHQKEERTRAKAAELAPHIERVLKALDWSGGTAEDFLRTIRDDSGLLTGWDIDQYGFMHLGFQEYLAAREIRSRALSEDQTVLSELASHFGQSWWQEVGLLLLALEDPSLFVRYMREVVKLPEFAQFPAMVEMCLDDAAEKYPQPFVELLEIDPGNDADLWKRQLVALRILERLDPTAVDKRQKRLARHPSTAIRQWIQERIAQTTMDVVAAKRGGYELVKISGGNFVMGSPESEKGHFEWESPLHEVQVSDFYLGRFSVTNEEYGRFLEENPDISEPKYWADRRFNQLKQPVVGVSWEDAGRYAAWAGLRLPSEAEWEYACRANTNTRYYTGDTEKDLDRAGWYGENSGGELHPVGEKEPNAYGLYDMHGNVYEWVDDEWHNNYDGAPNDGRAWIDKHRGANRVMRGGCWDGDARRCRSAARRLGSWPDYRYYYVGFRLSRSVALGP
jgi:formylglycine-generating enzyme required for sulfatase activity